MNSSPRQKKSNILKLVNLLEAIHKQLETSTSLRCASSPFPLVVYCGSKEVKEIHTNENVVAVVQSNMRRDVFDYTIQKHSRLGYVIGQK